MTSIATIPWSGAAESRCPEKMNGTRVRSSTTRRPGIRRRELFRSAGLALLAFCIHCGPEPEATANARLVDIPAPDFASMEPLVRGQLEGAQGRLDAALERPDSGPDELSRLLGRQGQLYLAYSLEQAAQACFLNAAQLAPDDFRWSYYLGTIQGRSGRWEESLDRYERALELNPAYLPAAVALADHHMEANHLDAAARFLDKVRGEASNPAVLVRRGRLASLRGDHDQAIRYLEAALGLEPGATAVFYPLGMAYRARGEVEKARYFMERQGARKVSLEDPLMEVLVELAAGSRSLQARGNEAYRQGRLQEALEAYRKAVEADPDNGEFRVNLAAVLSRLDDLESAAGQLRHALRLDPGDALAHFNLAAVLARQGRDRAALGHYREAIALRPDYKNAHFNLANALLRLRRFETAASHFDRVLEIEPGEPAALVGEGDGPDAARKVGSGQGPAPRWLRRPSPQPCPGPCLRAPAGGMPRGRAARRTTGPGHCAPGRRRRSLGLGRRGAGHGPGGGRPLRGGGAVAGEDPGGGAAAKAGFRPPQGQPGALPGGIFFPQTSG